MAVIREPPSGSGDTVGSQGLVRLAVRAIPPGDTSSEKDF